ETRPECASRKGHATRPIHEGARRILQGGHSACPGRHRPDDPTLVLLLIRSLDERDRWVGYRAIGCLGELGPRAKAALPRLEEHLLKPKAMGEDGVLDDSKMRELVTAIVSIAPRSTRTAATLLQALRDRDIRAVHCPKNTWFMRDRLEDELLAV